LKRGPNRRRSGQRIVGQGTTSRCIWITGSLKGLEFARRWDVANEGGEREMVMMRWGMPPPPRAGGYPVTNIRNTSSPHWRLLLNPEVYLRDILAKVADDHPISRIDELMQRRVERRVG
jgi:hypothetical protein